MDTFDKDAFDNSFWVFVDLQSIIAKNSEHSEANARCVKSTSSLVDNFGGLLRKLISSGTWPKRLQREMDHARTDSRHE